MTLPHERYRSVNQTREFLYELLDPKKTPRVPKAIRQQARHCLRHYPGAYDMERACYSKDKTTYFTEPVFAKDFLI